MKREFHAQFPFALYDSLTQGFAIARLVNPRARLPARWPEIAQIEDDWSRLEILSQAIITGRKEEARMGTRKMSGGLRYWIEHHAEAFFTQQLSYMRSLNLTTTLPDLSLFPSGSWAIRLAFTLRKPYISKDDIDFYILDNPIKKEWVFRVPYVAPSQWKGALQAAMVRQLVEESATLDNDAWVERRLQLARLFGNEKDVGVDDERFESYLDRLRSDTAKTYRERLESITPTGFLAGRLHFYPTFFDKINLEVINPHDRETGAGKHPIYLECVPAGTKGVFTLLYVPLDADLADEDTCQDDLKAVAQGTRTMLTKYGFGAKTSSGYGVADVDPNQIEVKPQEWREFFIKEWKENG